MARIERDEHQVYYAVVRWTVDDVRYYKPGWSEDQAHAWLAENARYIEDATVTAGNLALEQLLPWPLRYDEDDEDEEEENEDDDQMRSGHS